MDDPNITDTARAAAEIQAPTTEGWADDFAADRCTATRPVRTPEGITTVRCDAPAGHVGPRHQGHAGDQVVRWDVAGD